MRDLTDILQSINDQLISDASFGAKITAHKLAELQEKDEKTFPMVNTGRGQGTKISWDDKYPLQVYHRIIDVENETDPTKGFGANSHRMRLYKMRLVGIGSKDKITSTTREDNHEIANEIADIIAKFPNGDEYLEVTDLEVIKSEVYDSEFEGHTNINPKKLEGIAFWIEYDLKTVARCNAPNAPTLVLSAATTTGFTGTVTHSGFRGGFQWEYSTDQITWIVAGTTSNITKTFDYTELSSGTTYYARSKATGKGGSNYSSIVTIDTLTAVKNIDEYSYSGKSFDPDEINLFVFGSGFSPDGLRMYLQGKSGDIGSEDNIFQYSLSVAWDISTASYDSKSYPVEANDGLDAVYSILFNSAGSKMYLLDGIFRSVYQYTLSTAWDVSTASYDSVSFSFNSQDTLPKSLMFSTDGTKMYLAGSTNDNIYQYTLSTAWDLSTASYDSISLDVSTNGNADGVAAISESGEARLYTLHDGRYIHQYTMSTAWDISTASYDSISLDIGSQTAVAIGVTFNPDTSTFYANGGGVVFQYE